MKDDIIRKILPVGLGVATASQAGAVIVHVTADHTLQYNSNDPDNGIAAYLHVDELTPGIDNNSGTPHKFSISIGATSGAFTTGYGSPITSADKNNNFTAMDSGSQAHFFDPGDSINGFGNYINDPTYNDGDLNALVLDELTYLGFRFTANSQVQHGWVSVTLRDNTWNGTSDTDLSIELNQMAFTTEGEAITAGQIPEPATAAVFLAAGAAGLAAYRRRRKTQ